MNSKQPLIVDRILFPAMFYPYNYGFIPQTKEQQPGSNGEADPIDVFVLGNYSLWSAIACRPVGIILSKDQDGIDSKIIAVPLTNIDPTSYSSGKLAVYRSSSAASFNRTVYLIN